MLSIYIYVSQLFHQSQLVNCANLIQNDLASLSLKLAIDPAGIRSLFGCHRINNHCCDMITHLIRRNHQARARLLNFTARRWIQIDQIDLETLDYRLSFFGDETDLVFVKDVIPHPIDEYQNTIAKSDQAIDV